MPALSPHVQRLWDTHNLVYQVLSRYRDPKASLKQGLRTIMALTPSLSPDEREELSQWVTEQITTRPPGCQTSVSKPAA